MSEKSTIQWTESTWNPVRGCVKVSPGCAHCYAETFAERFRGVPGHPYEQGFDLRLVPEKLTEPLTWKKPRRIFVNSMSDLFQDGVPDSYIDQVFAVMALCPQHTFQVLTKRPERMRAYLTNDDCLTDRVDDAACVVAGACHANLDDRWPLPNVWLGCSVENQHFADERIPLLLQTPAAIRFISAEPLLGPVDLAGFIPKSAPWKPYVECRHGYDACPICDGNPKPALDWVIVGGESGPGARACQIEWARSILAQCQVAGVPCFVKQLGSMATANYYDQPTRDHIESLGADWPDPIGWHKHDGQPSLSDRVRLRLPKKGGDPAEWPAELRVREFPS